MKAKYLKRLRRIAKEKVILVKHNNSYTVELFAGKDSVDRFSIWETKERTNSLEEAIILYNEWINSHILCQMRDIYPVRKLVK